MDYGLIDWLWFFDEFLMECLWCIMSFLIWFLFCGYMCKIWDYWLIICVWLGLVYGEFVIV